MAYVSKASDPSDVVNDTVAKRLHRKYHPLANCSDRELIEKYLPGAVEFSGAHGSCWYQDRNSSILAVLSIKPLNGKATTQITHNDRHLLCSNLDKRFAHHLVLNALPELNCPVDVLVATRSAKGATGAAHFVPTKKYQLVIGFRTACETSQKREESDMGVRVNPHPHIGFTRLLNGFGYLVSEFGTSREIQALAHLDCAGAQFPILAKKVFRKNQSEWQLNTSWFNANVAALAGFLDVVSQSGTIIPREPEVVGTTLVRGSVDKSAANRLAKALLNTDSYRRQFTR
jgi:hypothetical protein